MAGIYRTASVAMAGLAADWTAENIVLGAGVVGVETDSGKAKMGNGTSTWTALSYMGATGTAGVTTFNTRTGAVTLTSGDITSAGGATSAQLPAAASTSTAGLVKKAPAMADVTGWTDTTAMGHFNTLLANLRTAGLM